MAATGDLGAGINVHSQPTKKTALREDAFPRSYAKGYQRPMQNGKPKGQKRMSRKARMV